MAPLTPSDEAEVRALVTSYADTWNRHDLDGMHSIDTEDVEWINVRGNHWRGKSVVFKGHDALLSTALAKSKLDVISLDVREVAGGVAIAVATMKFGPLTIPTGEDVPFVKTIGSFVVLKAGGSWKIAHFHNTLIDAEAEHNDPTTWDETGYSRERST